MHSIDASVTGVVVCLGIHLLRSISNVSCLLFVTVSSLRSGVFTMHGCCCEQCIIKLIADDGELIYWALCLLHELVMKGETQWFADCH